MTARAELARLVNETLDSSGVGVDPIVDEILNTALDHPQQLLDTLVAQHGHDTILALVGGTEEVITSWEAVSSDGDIALSLSSWEHNAKGRIQQFCDDHPMYRPQRTTRRQIIVKGLMRRTSTDSIE